MPKFREGTHDEPIWKEVTEGNLYRLPDRLPEGSIVIDIGAHIGSFSYEAAKRGAGKVYAFEASLENYKIANENLAEFIESGTVELFHLAVWDKNGEFLNLHTEGGDAFNVKENTGGYSLFDNWRTNSISEEVETISLDSLLATEIESKPVELVKFDCGGAEYKIFYGSQLFDKQVKKLIGETHERENIGYTRELSAYFESKGYRIIDCNDSPSAHLGFIEVEKNI